LDFVRATLQGEFQRQAPNVRGPFALKVVSVFSEGFDEGAKKRSCKASLQMTAPKPNVADQLAALSGKVTNNVELLRVQIEWEQSPHQDVLKRGVIDFDITYTATLELQSKDLMVDVTPADAQQWETLNSYLAMANRLSVIGATVQPGRSPVAAPAQEKSSGAPQSTAVSDRRMFQLRDVEMCGSEALCVYTMSGETLTTNAFGLDQGQKQTLTATAAARRSLCFRGLSGDGKELDFESVSEYCQ
jgi:hypothetical protein